MSLVNIYARIRYVNHPTQESSPQFINVDQDYPLLVQQAEDAMNDAIRDAGILYLVLDIAKDAALTPGPAPVVSTTVE